MTKSERPVAPKAPVTSSDVGLYVHFPYCEKKCPYCDFNSHAVPFDGRRYAEGIKREIEARAPEYPLGGRGFRSIYFGGGTPSLWDPAEVAGIITLVRERFGLGTEVEITLEANPGTAKADLFDRFVAAGVTRFSIGAQSFRDPELVQLGRIHDSRAGIAAVQLAKASGARVSLDLIYGQPEQTFTEVAASLDRALELEPEHISAYTLTIEPDTIFGRQVADGRLVPMEDDAQADLIERTTQILAAAGFERYEVSSYARDRQEAIHNSIYWSGGPYLGVGAGAHSYLPKPGLSGAVRSGNIKSPELYLSQVFRAAREPAVEESLDRRAVLADRLWVGLRVRWGIDLFELADEAGLPDLTTQLEPVLLPLIEQGLLLRSGARIVPSRKGFLFSDAIAKQMIRAARNLHGLGAEA